MQREESWLSLFVLLLLLIGSNSSTHALLLAQTANETNVRAAQAGSVIHQAARTGNLEFLRSELRRGVNPNVRDASGRTPLPEAVSGGHLDAVRLLLSSGADVNARTADGRTALIEASARGWLSITRQLVAAGADLNLSQRGWGTALETAERFGHTEIAVVLRQAGAQSSGRSPGDKICVCPWGGEGYCGTVLSINKTRLLIRVTEIVGCKEHGACPAKDECSAGQPVGGDGGIAVGDQVSAMTWCLTHTGVKP